MYYIYSGGSIKKYETFEEAKVKDIKIKVLEAEIKALEAEMMLKAIIKKMNKL